jgi:hypothetical protein
MAQTEKKFAPSRRFSSFQKEIEGKTLRAMRTTQSFAPSPLARRKPQQPRHTIRDAH